MRILIATPLYPPDVEPSAEYTYELAKQLSTQHRVTVVTYGTLTEPTPKVTVVAVPKDEPLLPRMVQYMRTCMTLIPDADVILIHNGPSVELPVLLATLFAPSRLILHESDERARSVRKRNMVHGLIHVLIALRAQYRLEGVPLPKPEILPFTEFPTAAHEEYTRSWSEHLERLTTLFAHES